MIKFKNHLKDKVSLTIMTRNNRLIIPKIYVKDINYPIIFLAGPIRSAPNWQDKAIKYIISKDPNIIIASPRRGIRDNISPYIITGDENYFPRQRAWERHYLDVATSNGAIMFWLPFEEEHNCNKVYGAMTRFELGLVLGWYKYNKEISFCIGTDNDFSEFDIMNYDLKLDAPLKEIQYSLEKTCDKAIELANQKFNKK
jgi:hypothetical protein